MKHIKSYEEAISDRFNYKFNIGDPVRIKNEPIIYIVNGYNYQNYSSKYDVYRLLKYEDKDKLVNKEGMFSWVLEDKLELVSDDDLQLYLAAKKYNI